MARDVIHISKAEAASNFAALLDRVSEGAEIVIEENDARPVAILKRPSDPHLRLLSESLRIAPQRAAKLRPDEDFARDLNEVINSHQEPLDPPAWD